MQKRGEGNPISAYVALGDSISIDAYAGGPGRGGASLLHHNRDEDFPEWAGRDLSSRAPGISLHLLATDGATSSTVADRQLPQLRRSGVVPDLATLTIGGADLLQAYGDTAAARAVIRRGRSVGRRTLSELLGLMGPTAPIVVGTGDGRSDGTGRS